MARWAGAFPDLLHLHGYVSHGQGPALSLRDCGPKRFLLLCLCPWGCWCCLPWRPAARAIRYCPPHRYIGEDIQKTGVAIETRGFTFVTAGKKRETLNGDATIHYYEHLVWKNIETFEKLKRFGISLWTKGVESSSFALVHGTKNNKLTKHYCLLFGLDRRTSRALRASCPTCSRRSAPARTRTSSAWTLSTRPAWWTATCSTPSMCR